MEAHDTTTERQVHVTEPQDPLAVIEQQLSELEQHVDMDTVPSEEYVERLIQATVRLSLQARLSALRRKLGPQPKHAIPALGDPTSPHYVDEAGTIHYLYIPTTRDPIRDVLSGVEFEGFDSDDASKAIDALFPVNTPAPDAPSPEVNSRPYPDDFSFGVGGIHLGG